MYTLKVYRHKYDLISWKHIPKNIVKERRKDNVHANSSCIILFKSKFNYCIFVYYTCLFDSNSNIFYHKQLLKYRSYNMFLTTITNTNCNYYKVITALCFLFMCRLQLYLEFSHFQNSHVREVHYIKFSQYIP